MAITWFEDSGDLKLPDVKRVITNSGVVVFILPTIYERFLKGWTYSSSDINSLFSSSDGKVSITSSPKDGSSINAGTSYYLAEKPTIETKYACWGKSPKVDSNRTEAAYIITLHLFYVKSSDSTGDDNGGGGGGWQYAL